MTTRNREYEIVYHVLTKPSVYSLASKRPSQVCFAKSRKSLASHPVIHSKHFHIDSSLFYQYRLLSEPTKTLPYQLNIQIAYNKVRQSIAKWISISKKHIHCMLQFCLIETKISLSI